MASCHLVAGGDLSSVIRIAEGDTSGTAYRDGQGKRLSSLGNHSGGVFRPWSGNVVPMSCPFEKCPYPPGGTSRSWKTWQNHCSTAHGWNISAAVKSRTRAGKDKAGDNTAPKATAVQTVGARRVGPDPNVKKSPRRGAQTVVRDLGNESQESDKSEHQATGVHGSAPLRTFRRSPRDRQ